MMAITSTYEWKLRRRRPVTGEPATGVGTGFALPPAFFGKTKNDVLAWVTEIVLLNHDVTLGDP